MKLKLCEIVQQLEYIDLDFVKKVLDERDSIKDYAYIIHDKDKDDEGELKAPHVHIAIRLKDSYDTKYISEWFNVKENYVCKVKGRWADMLKYLIHENAKDKFQYDKEEVVSNFDWQNEKEKSSKKDLRRLEICNFIVSGIIREYNYFKYISIEEYDKYKKSIDNAFKYRADLIKGVQRDMKCVFITGDSGTGKTTYAKQIANDNKYSIYISSSSNDVLDDYKGQDCIILDDLRPSSMGLSDLLKMLDNHTASTVKSRYRNKVLECKMIIITTTLTIDKFFNNVFSEERETIVQLKRRCSLHARVTMDYIYLSLWQEKSRCYGKEFKQVNPLSLQNRVKDLDENEQMNAILGILGDTQHEFLESVEDLEEIEDDIVPF